MDAIGAFRKILAEHHTYAKEWKERTGGQVFGYYETYMPEELVYAAGILPVRLLAEHEPDYSSDRQIYASCYYARDLLNAFVMGRYDYIDGVVNAEGCQWLFHSFQNVVNNNPALFNHYVFVPDYTGAKTSKDVLRSELDVFKTHLEEWIGHEITTEAIDNAIEVYNTNRRLLRRIYELRKADKPVIYGSEMMTLLLCSQIMDKAEMNPMLEALIPVLESKAGMKDRIRLILIGSETYDVNLEKLVESLGADIVCDELDNGSSYIWNEVIPQKDRLMALAHRYLERPHCALKDNNWRRRPEHIYQLCEDFQVDGALVQKQIYCHPHGTDNYMVWKLMRERGIPFHFFERDSTLPLDETTVRLESFLNMIRPGLVRLVGWHNSIDI